MASEYDFIKRGKLVLKGQKSSGKKRKLKKKEDEPGPSVTQDDADTVAHGGWWKTHKYEDITGAVCIEFGNGMYVRALDNGLITLGAPHDEGEGPAPEEILTCFPASENKVALKSGYGKYLSVDKSGIVVGRSDAVGPMEQWEPVFQEGKLALLTGNDCFMSVDSEDSIVANSRKAGPEEFLCIRTAAVKAADPLADIPTEERGKLSEVEENYVRKFQKFQDKKIKICAEDRKGLKLAKDDGTLHEALLNRREKMKADRYCK